MGRGIITIQLAIIPHWLRLPGEFKAVSAHYDPVKEIIQILIENESIQNQEGEQLPIVTPHYKREYLDSEEKVGFDKLESIKIEHQAKSYESIEETMTKLGIRRREHGDDRA